MFTCSSRRACLQTCFPNAVGSTMESRLCAPEEVARVTANLPSRRLPMPQWKPGAWPSKGRADSQRHRAVAWLCLLGDAAPWRFGLPVVRDVDASPEALHRFLHAPSVSLAPQPTRRTTSMSFRVSDSRRSSCALSLMCGCPPIELWLRGVHHVQSAVYLSELC